MTSPTTAIPGFCGIDVGTQGVRAVVVDDSGRELGRGSAPIVGDRRAGREHEQDPQAWWDAVVLALRGALAQCPEADVQAVALDATSGTVLVAGADGRAHGPGLMYDDGRAVEQGTRASSAGAALWDALGYRMQPSWALPKVMWLVEQGRVGRGARVVHQSDHLVARLVGAPVPTDTSHALKTGVDLRTGGWPEELFSELGLPRHILPEVVPPGTALGVIGPEAGPAPRRPPTAVVRAGMTDGCAAQIASGALRPGQWSSALGTTLVLKGASRTLVRDPSGAVYCHRHPDGGWLPGGASSSGAGIFGSLFPGAGPQRLRELTELAAASPPVEGATYPLTGRGERFPFVAPTAVGFTSREARSDAEIFSAVCHGLAHLEHLAYDVLSVLGADTSGTVAFSGGASGNPWLNQLRADALGRSAVLPRSTDAATGMAILSAAPAGRLTDTADAMVHVTQTLDPDPGRHLELRSGYRDLVEELVDRGWLDGDLAGQALAVSAVVR